MKSIHTSVFLIFISVLAFSSCSKNTDTPTTPTVPYPMTATIGSTAFSADTCWYSIDIVDTTTISISGSPGLNLYPIVELHLTSGYHGVGTYSLSNTGGSKSYFYARLYQTSSSGGEYSGAGTVTITATTPTTVSGTFSFTTVTTNTVVSNGSFTALKF